MIAEKIKRKFSELLGESTAFGLPKIFKSKRIFFKIFWSLYFLGRSIATAFFLKESVQSFFEYEVVSKIGTKFPNSMQFPTVSICPDKHISLNNVLNIVRGSYFNSEYLNNLHEYFEKFSTNLYGDCIRFNNGKNFTGYSV